MEERIVEIMKEVFDEQDININSSQDSLEKWSSLRHLSLVSELEDEFDINIDPKDISEMKSVADIVRILKSLGVE